MSSGSVNRDRASIVQDLESQDEEVRRLAVERLSTLPAAESVPRLIESLGDPGWRVRKAAVGRLAACSERDRVIDALLSALADGENPGRRNSAVEALVGLAEGAVPRLVDTLHSADSDVRKFAVDALAGIGSLTAQGPLLESLSDTDPNIRAAAADALGVVGGEGAVEALLPVAVSSEEDRLVCFSALRALARLEAPLRAAELTPALEDSTLRAAAFALLGRLDDAEAVERLLKGVSSGSRAAREAAITALLRLLGNVDDARATALTEQIRTMVGAPEAILDQLSDRLVDADLSTRLVLVQFLGVLGEGSCALPILRAGRDEAIREVAQGLLAAMGQTAERAIDGAWDSLDPDLRCDACALLARGSGQESAARLLRSLDDGNPELRIAAARAVGQRRLLEATPALVRQMESATQEEDDDSDDEVAALIDALVAISGAEAEVCDRPDADGLIELLTARLDGAPEPVRLSIARVLSRVGRRQDAELVTSLLKDPSSAVRRAAVAALSRLDSESASDPLRLALADESPPVRVAAAAAVGDSNRADSVEDLRRLLHDDDERVRAASVRAIGALCRPSESDERISTCQETALELLALALGDSGIVAMAAVASLEAIGGPRAASAARGLLARPEPELVQAAVQCIGAHGEADALLELITLVAHPSWAVRAEAVQTLAERGVVKAVPPILRRLETEQDDFVRDAILRALKRLEG